VGSIITATKAREERLFPSRISRVETGRVPRISMDPLRYSSENCLMVTAGMVKLKITGIMEKKERISARPARKKVLKKNHPEIKR
jgi:hypothetical protein